jgi:hypothetical protein
LRFALCFPRSKRGGFADSLARDGEIGGLCGHCSRDLPHDRRLLFVAELTGRMTYSLIERPDWKMVAEAGFEPAMRGV